MRRRWVTFVRIIQGGIVSFIRNASLAIAAMAVMVVTLTIVLFSVITNAAFGNTIAQITAKIDVSVYLSDSDTTAQVDKLVAQLSALPNVKSVQYESKDQVRATYEAQNAGNQDLITALQETNNPLPATVIIKPVNLNYIQNIKRFLTEPSVSALQSYPPSYSGNQEAAINKITRATDVLREIGVVTVIVFAIISALIIFNTIQMAIFNRRDEVQIMRLLGASTWYIRGPCVVESTIYGIMSAVFSVAIINAGFVASNNALQASSLGILDINYANSFFDAHFWQLLTVQVVVGIVIGAASSIIATQRYLRFKIK